MTTKEWFSGRPVESSADLSRMYELALASDEPTYTLDLPWRFASPAMRVPAWSRVWEEPDGELSAWAVLQFPYHCLDFAVRPGAGKDERQDLVLAWAVDQLTIVATDGGEDLPFYISAREHDANRIAAIERAGFGLRPGSFIGMERDLALPIPEVSLPTGITIRPLNAASEVPSYVAVHGAAFESDDMTVEWRAAAIEGPHYTPDLDLVAVAADGSFAGFCICWLGQTADGVTFAQIEPLGVSPAYHRQGIGRALLLETMKRAKAHGAQRVAVYVASYNDAAIAAYAAVGFRTAYHLRFFLRTFAA